MLAEQTETPPFLPSTVALWLDRMSELTGYDVRPVGTAMVRINRRFTLAQLAGDAEGMLAALYDAEMLLDVAYPTLAPASASNNTEGPNG
jgi:hypothetical protein